VRGAKKWLLWPPHAPPPGVHASADGADVATTMSVFEWFVDFYPAARRQAARMRRAARGDPAALLPVECVVRAGECIFVPRGWWHAVLNLEDDCIAVTSNFCSEAGLPAVLDFLQRMPHHAISGVPPADAPTLRARFIEALREHHPDALARALAPPADARGGGGELLPQPAQRPPPGTWARALAQPPAAAPFAFAFAPAE
jgi:hypothetical protein